MRLVGLLTEDPRAYFEMLEVLREQDLKYISLEFSDPIPANVAVVLTTEHERHRVQFDAVVSDDDPEVAIEKAKKALSGDRNVNDLMIGIDPGHRPGVAALGDGVVLSRSLAPTPEAVREMVEGILENYPSNNVIIRIGHGDRTNRNRIFNRLWDDGHKLEIVDERNTTTR
jgi:predicted RNase H-like nuclease (RuvC/YqgF family)